MWERQQYAIPHPRFLAFAALLGSIFAALKFLRLDLDLSLLTAFDVAALAYIAAAIGPWRAKIDPPAMARRSARDRDWRTLLLLCSAALVVAVLASVVTLLHDWLQLGLPAALLAVATEIIAWAFVNLVYAYHYARLYHDPRDGESANGGIELPGNRTPTFPDFVNFAFVIGMTCQTADIGISSERIRRASTFHGIAAFFFNLGVLAITINIVAWAM